MSERDTHFQGFAKLLYEDFLQLARDDESIINEMLAPNYPEKWRIKVEQLIAQRGYDLVYHVLDNIWEVHNSEVLLDKTPDLTEWPERS